MVCPVQRSSLATIPERLQCSNTASSTVAISIGRPIARGEAVGGGDVDLLVGFETPPSFSEYMRLRIHLEDLLGSEIVLITERGLKERVRPYVEKDAIRVT